MIKREKDKWVLYTADGSRVLGTHDTQAEAEAQERAVEVSKHRGAMRALHLVGATGAVRTEMWDGREHLVVPMVALMEGVIHAVNAKTAEFVSGDALRASVGKWAGHPIVVGHPTRDGKQISAHSPEVLAKHGCGFIRSTAMNGNRLVHETLIDPARLEQLGHKALADDLRAGKGAEVSVGAFVNTNGTKSVWNGKAYDGEWTEIGPDHTALLPGGIGACSMSMGCGAHRAAMLVTAEGFEALGDSPGHEFHGNQYSAGTPGGTTGEKLQKAGYTKVYKEGSVAAHDKGTVNLTVPAGHTMYAQEFNSEDKAFAAQDKFQYHEHPGAVASSVTSPQLSNNFYDKHVHSVTVKNQEWKSSPTKEAALKLRSKASQKYFRGNNMNITDIKSRILALFDTPEQAASEEAAELIAYNSMRTLFDGVGDQWDAASGLIDDLIADEEENPTVTPGQEQAEEEVEDARLDAIRMHCYSMIAALQSVCNACTEQQMPEPMPASDPRYMEAFKALVGKEISAKNMKTIQAAHDSSHAMHDQTTALGAECGGGMKAASTKDCPTCDGTGQITKDGKQMDCPACDGEGVYKAAASAADNTESGRRAAEEGQMTKEQKAAALKALGACGCAEAKIKTLETDDQVFEAMMETAGTHAATLKAAQDKATEVEAKLRAAEAAQIPAEELAQLRSLAAAKQATDAAEKVTLVTKLLAASKALTKEQLEAKSLDDLKTLAAFAKVDVDFSVKGIPVQRAASDASDYAPPNPYEAGIKAAQAKVN